MVEKPNAPRNQDPAAGGDLYALLADAEHRKETDRKSKSRMLTWVLAIPTVILIAWVAGFLIIYQPPADKTPETQQVSPTPEELTQRKDREEFDPFLPNAQRVNPPAKSPQPEPGGQKIIDKGDIDFAMQLLNFSHGPAAPKPKPAAKEP